MAHAIVKKAMKSMRKLMKTSQKKSENIRPRPTSTLAFTTDLRNAAEFADIAGPSLKKTAS
jgi:hypothetical protein